ncbi:MAG: xanthan lyase [Alistipes sp.]|nr:xanthan lyase [Alistipes sp.]
MKKPFKKIFRLAALFVALFISSYASAQVLSSTDREEVSKLLTRIVSREILGGSAKVDRTKVYGDRVEIYASIGLSYYPFREDNVQAIYDSVRMILPEKYASRKVQIFTDNHRIEELIPMYYRTSKGGGVTFTNRSSHPLVSRLSELSRPTEGLSGRHIALWQSHGRYFEQKENIWRWQRSRLWETVEDLYTQSYVLPYLVPMLENAGANVLLPRERDTQKNELIIDNDESLASGRYQEQNGKAKWESGGVGFAHKREYYLTGQNPFKDGTARVVESVDSGKESLAEWYGSVAQDGRYAVYVSYESFGDKSAKDAKYTVYHKGGESHFAVNQSMGGSMWVYLGHFEFSAGEEALLVSLSNVSSTKGKKISADGVKIGGGYGNVARIVGEHLRKDDIEYEPMVSEYPRFCEGARYWLQWSGFEEDVYTPKENKDDYKDDYMSRAHWVNALMGGSERLPKEKGKNIPLDLAFAFHSDAGVRLNDDIIGTLGIYYTKDNKGRFVGGADRYLSRNLTDLVMTQIVGDIRSKYEPNWNRRGMWNRSYYEARVPSVPTMLLELLSHQNFADMRYGNDPRFKFLVSRAIYKGILRYLSSQYNVDYTVQPLPVEGFSVEFVDANSPDVVLRWQAVKDELEPSADPDYYIVYTRKDDGGFDNGQKVNGTSLKLKQELGHRYSYKVTAVNKGGESFSSEILSSCKARNERGRVLIVNGFDRVSAPISFQGDSIAGFYNNLDSGVGYLEDISFIGEQRNFDRRESRTENDNYALGSSYSDYESEVVAGNSFDYPALHGKSVVEAGFSFCSASVKSVEQGGVKLEKYPITDFIFGKQRSCQIGRGACDVDFEVFSEELQDKIRAYTEQGGAVFASGCYVASDLWHGVEADGEDRGFARSVLHYSFGGDMATRRHVARVVASPMKMSRQDVSFNREPSGVCYGVESPGSVVPYGKDAYIAMRYMTNNQSAAVAYNGTKYRTFVMGFPFETIMDEQQRHILMRGVLNFLSERKSDK